MDIGEKVTCAVLISHYKSMPFLDAAVRQIRKHRHPNVDHHIYIIDQSGDFTFGMLKEWYKNSEDITLIQCEPHYSGFGIDFAIRYFDMAEDFVCQLHADAFPISNAWLNLPITLINEFDYAFVGQLQFISKSTDTIYPPNVPMFAMAQCFNVAKMSTYTEMSMEAGFTRFHARPKVEKWATFKNNDWRAWAKKDYEHRGSDDDVVAFYWEDKYRQHDKLGLAITGYIEPSYGRIVEDIVFHFGSCREALGVMDKMPEGYVELTRRIMENYNDELIDHMVEMATKNLTPDLEILSRNHWDGIRKFSMPPSPQVIKRIEQLKPSQNVLDAGAGSELSDDE